MIIMTLSEKRSDYQGLLRKVTICDNEYQTWGSALVRGRARAAHQQSSLTPAGPPLSVGGHRSRGEATGVTRPGAEGGGMGLLGRFFRIA